MKTRSLILAAVLGCARHAANPLTRNRQSRASNGCTFSIAATSRSTTWAASRPAIPGPARSSSTCYLIKHAQGWLLWDTGLGDAVAAMPEGQKSNAGVWHVKKTLASQLAEIGVKPSDIRYLALSHSHGDHVGNVELFPQATLVVQKAEYDWPEPTGTPRFTQGHEGDQGRRRSRRVRRRQRDC